MPPRSFPLSVQDALTEVGIPAFGWLAWEIAALLTIPWARLPAMPLLAGKSGIDSVRVVRGIAECCEADIVIAVDSLAARSEVRVGRVLQLSESGIAPASGVRKGSACVDRTSVGVPVIAIGIPTALSEDGGDARGYLSVGEDLLEICEVGAFVVSEMIKNAFKPKEE